MGYQHLDGHLTIFIEPVDPVLPTGNRDPLLGQRTTNTTTTQDTTQRQTQNTLTNPQPSTSYAHHNSMIADSTHKSPQLPSESIEPLQLQLSAIPSSRNSLPVPSTYDEANYSEDDDTDNNSENETEEQDQEQNIAPNPTPNPTPDPIHMPEQKNAIPPQEDIPQNENENEKPHTPDPDNPIEDNTEFPNPNYEIPELQQNDQPQPGTSTSNSNTNSELTKFLETPDFQETMRKMTVQVGESTFNRIAQNPKLVKQWILQVIHKFPGLLDDQTDNTVQFVDTDKGQVRIMQPSPTQNPQPLDQHETSQVREVAPHPPSTLQQQEENNYNPTNPTSTSPNIISSESSDSENDCVIQKVSPCPKTKSFKRRAPPLEVTSPQIILKKVPHKSGTKAYTVTTIADIHGQPTTTDHTGQKRLRLNNQIPNDQTPQPSTSTSTTTTQQHKDKKHRKHKKDRKRDRDN